MTDRRTQHVEEQTERETLRGFGGSDQAPLARHDRTGPDRSAQTSGQPAPALRDVDRRGARILVLATIAGAIVVAGGIEWFGWQIVYRHADSPMVTPPDLLGVPRGQWALGMVRNAVAALGVGIGTAALALLFARNRKQRWRAAAVAFALGTATVLAALAGLTSWAP